MKLVPKPEGFELRDKRSTKEGDGSLWNVQDALHDASQEMAKYGVMDVLICWREIHSDDTATTHYRHAGPTGTAPSLIMQVLGRMMGWK